MRVSGRIKAIASFLQVLSLKPSSFLADTTMIVKALLPIYIVSFASLYTLMMLVAFGWIGRTILIASISTGMYLAARHVFKHHSMIYGGGLSQEKMDEARDWWITLCQTKEVNR